MTHSPTLRRLTSPTLMAGRPVASIFTTATSLRLSNPILQSRRKLFPQRVGCNSINISCVSLSSNPKYSVRIQTSGAISNAASGIVIAGNTLQLQGGSYSNAGNVGSFGDATLIL